MYKRPEAVQGTTYKLRPAGHDEALYLTINHIELEDGTLRPIEVFLNSKNMESFPWITALTRMLSALFRQEGDYTFIIEELSQVFDPAGGYFIPGTQGQRVDSVVAHIATVLERHFRELQARSPTPRQASA